MGFKINLILLGLFLSTVSVSAFYIKYLHNQVAVLKSNAIVLETEIEKQNESIKNHLAEQKRVNEQINILEDQNQQAMREVKEVRDKFARHDLNNLALMKPGLIERRVNAGTKKVMTDLIELTNPKQFDETLINN